VVDFPEYLAKHIFGTGGGFGFSI